MVWNYAHEGLGRVNELKGRGVLRVELEDADGQEDGSGE